MSFSFTSCALHYAQWCNDWLLKPIRHEVTAVMQLWLCFSSCIWPFVFSHQSELLKFTCPPYVTSDPVIIGIGPFCPVWPGLFTDVVYGHMHKLTSFVISMWLSNTFQIATAYIHCTVINPSIHSFMAYIKVIAIIYLNIVSFCDWFSFSLRCSYRKSISSHY